MAFGVYDGICDEGWAVFDGSVPWLSIDVFLPCPLIDCAVVLLIRDRGTPVRQSPRTRPIASTTMLRRMKLRSGLMRFCPMP